MDLIRDHLLDPLGVRFWAEIGLAVLCGGMLGLERQIRGKPCGIRTSILICMGTILFLRLGAGMQPGSGADPTRVLGQVVTGIGFLGGGVIIAKGGAITGLTSAATIWVLAAIGAAIANGLHAMAVSVTIVTLTVLVGVEALQNGVRRLQRGEHRRDARERQDRQDPDDF